MINVTTSSFGMSSQQNSAILIISEVVPSQIKDDKKFFDLWACRYKVDDSTENLSKCFDEYNAMIFKIGSNNSPNTLMMVTKL